MAKKVYYGVGGIARKVKKIYYGAGGIARKVRRGYIGVGGIARPFWTGGELAYYGNSEDGAIAKPEGNGYNPAVSNVDYALFPFFSGNIANAYDKHLLHRSVNVSISWANIINRSALAGGYAVFASGINPSGASTAAAFAISNTLSVRSANYLSTARNLVGTANTKSYALFAGGQPYANNNGFGAPTQTVDTYSSGLSRGTAPNLGVAKDGLTGESFAGGGYALFAGGGYANSSSSQGRFKTIEAYNNALVRKSLTDLDSTSVGGHASTEEHALFILGSSINAYNKELVKTQVPNNPNTRNLTGLHVRGYALFAGGSLTVAYGYNKNLTYVEVPVRAPHSAGGAAAVGDYGLFAGNIGSANTVGISAYTA